MTQASTVELQQLIERIGQGSVEARRSLLERAYQRMQALAAIILQRSFPDMAGRHEVDSILSETWLRLVQALDKVQPPTVADFFRLAAHKMRQVLLDLVHAERRHAHSPLVETVGGTQAPTPAAGGNQTYDPARLALWTELHHQVESLPSDQQAVFEMHYYLGMPQAEIARVLDLHPRKVSHLWIAATDKLADCVSRELLTG
ncbi:MAG TPA: sigma-70 family RNA polymerase sigma factor [Pirellulaceae bacterium]|nr:sigma-70 family RNA polymerase sigma factor [Pirellulaceae bacterium]